MNAPGASGTTFSRNSSYNGRHQALSAQLASAFCHSKKGLEGKILHPTGAVGGAVLEDQTKQKVISPSVPDDLITKNAP